MSEALTRDLSCACVVHGKVHTRHGVPHSASTCMGSLCKMKRAYRLRYADGRQASEAAACPHRCFNLSHHVGQGSIGIMSLQTGVSHPLKPTPIIGAPASTSLGSTPLDCQNMYVSCDIFNLSHGCTWFTAVGRGMLAEAGRFATFALVSCAFAAFAFIAFDAFAFVAFAFIAFAFIAFVFVAVIVMRKGYTRSSKCFRENLRSLENNIAYLETHHVDKPFFELLLHADIP